MWAVRVWIGKATLRTDVSISGNQAHDSQEAKRVEGYEVNMLVEHARDWFWVILPRNELCVAHDLVSHVEFIAVADS